MAVPKYLEFAFLPREREDLVAALETSPSIARGGDAGARWCYHVVLPDSRCRIELGRDHGTLVFTPGEGDAAAAVAQAVLSDGGAVFTACC